MIQVTVLSAKAVLFEGQAWSLFLPGDQGEFEVLTHHAPIVSLLRSGRVVIDWEKSIPIQRGMMQFHDNECVILIEE
jgi:F-type H+-transporting ATPase subunit epsilon